MDSGLIHEFLITHSRAYVQKSVSRLMLQYKLRLVGSGVLQCYFFRAQQNRIYNLVLLSFHVLENKIIKA